MNEGHGASGPGREEPEDRLSLQEALRTVGSQLENERRQLARLTVTATGIAVDAEKEWGYRWYPWNQLARLSRALRDQRRGARQAAAGERWDPTRWSVLLRVTGQILDRQAVRACAIEISAGRDRAPEDCEVRVVVGDRVILSTASVLEQVQLLRLRQSASQHSGPSPASAPQRHWWAPWRSR